MKAVILAAGKGRRLGSLTEDIPKPMLPLQGNTPLLEMIIRGIRDAGIREFIIITGYLAYTIRNYFGDGSHFGITPQYIVQGKLNGTGGAVGLVRSFVGDSPFLMSFGDILISPHNYQRLVHDYQNNPSTIIMVNEVDDPYKGSAVYFDRDTREISRIIEKPPKGTSTSKWNQAGISLFEPDVFEYLGRIDLSPRGEYEIVDAIQLMISEQRTVRALPIEGFWSDIGTPEDVESVRRQFAENADFLRQTVEPTF